MAKREPNSESRARRKFNGNPEDFRLSLVEHLDELRTRVIRSVIVLAITTTIGWYYFPPVYAFLNQMVVRSIRAVVPADRFVEKFDNLTGPFMLQLHLAFLIGLALAFPFLVVQIWGFIAPALKDEERKPLKQIAPASVLLFSMGVGFCWLIMPMALQWFAEYLRNFDGASLFQTAGTMVFFILKMLLAFGIAFQLPLFVYVLGVLDLLKAETLIKYWRHSATGIFIFSMIATPSQDPLSMLIMAIPLTILFAISVFAVKFTQGRKKKREQAAHEVKTYLLPTAQITESVPESEETEQERL